MNILKDQYNLNLVLVFKCQILLKWFKIFEGQLKRWLIMNQEKIVNFA